MATKSYIVLCRHGQRAPGRMLLPSDATLWSPLTLPHSHPSLLPLFRKFPVFSHVYNDVPHDQARYPFGSITTHGIRYAREVGRQVGQHFPAISDCVRSGERVKVLASNYRRTQITAQCLLDGISSLRPDEAEEEAGRAVRIAVEDRLACPLAFYDCHPAITNHIINKVLLSDAYRSEANKKEVVKAQAELSRAIPELARGPYGFDWPMAFDFFVCGASHREEIPATAWHGLEALQEHEQVALEHFIFRYWSYYSDKEHLGFFLDRLLDSMLKDLQTIRAEPAKSHFMLYSGHDINLFAFLIALGDPNCVRGPLGRKLSTESVHSLWPAYASTVVLECTPEAEEVRFKVFRDLEEVSATITCSLKGLTQLRDELRAERTSSSLSIASHKSD